jgi:phosphatidylinositol alpha-1,6-mannosyltransferase
MEKEQELLVITELFLPTKGGSAVWFDEVYRRLGRKKIHIVTADVQGAIEYDRDHPNTVHRVSLQRHWWLRPESLVMYLKLFFKSIGVAIGHDFSAVHAGRVLPEGFIAWLVARLIRRPLVIYAHGEEITTWRQPLKFRFMAFSYKHADKVIANSEFTKDELLKIGVEEKSIVLISPGVDIERFRPGLACHDLRASLGIGEEQKLVLSVGRLSRRKGFDQLVRAVARLAGEGIDLHYALIGIGDDKERLLDIISKESVADRVHLLGHVPMSDLPRWYNACDVFAMPNREIDGDTEGFGMVFTEAAACGKPAIAGNAGGTGSAVIHNETGFRVDGESLDAIVAALEKLLRDPDLTSKMGRRALQRVTQELSWEQVANQTLSMGGCSE